MAWLPFQKEYKIWVKYVSYHVFCDICPSGVDQIFYGCTNLNLNMYAIKKTRLLLQAFSIKLNYFKHKTVV